MSLQNMSLQNMSLQNMSIENTQTSIKAYYYLLHDDCNNKNFYVDDIPDHITDIIYSFWLPTFDEKSNPIISSFNNYNDFSNPLDPIYKPSTTELLTNGSNYTSKENPGIFNALQQYFYLYPNKNIKLVIGDSNRLVNWSTFIDTKNKRAKLVQSIITFLSTYTFFNGIVIDWTYISNNGINYGPPLNTVTLDDDINAFKFMKDLYNKIHKLNSTFTLALCCTPIPSNAKFDSKRMSEVVDEMYIMCMDYNFNFTEDVYNIINNKTSKLEWYNEYNSSNPMSFHTNPRNSNTVQFSVESSIDYYISSGVPSNKLFIGIPFYSRGYTGVSNQNIFNPNTYTYKGNCLQPIYDNFKYGDLTKLESIDLNSINLLQNIGKLPYNEIVNLIHNTDSKIIQDPISKGTYIAIPTFDTTIVDNNKFDIFIFDSKLSIKEKCNIVFEKNLGGVVVTDLSSDIRLNQCSYSSIDIDNMYSILDTYLLNKTKCSVGNKEDTLSYNIYKNLISSDILINTIESFNNNIPAPIIYGDYVLDNPSNKVPISTPNRRDVKTELNICIKKKLNQVYNNDIDAMRNIGSVAKSLLSGRNYHNIITPDPGILTLPVNTVTIDSLNVKNMTIGTNTNLSINGNKNTTVFKVKGKAIWKDRKSNIGDPFPIGSIIAFYKTEIVNGRTINSPIPLGWAICDGTKGTPDLRGRFILGGTTNSNLNFNDASFNTNTNFNGYAVFGSSKPFFTENGVVEPLYRNGKLNLFNTGGTQMVSLEEKHLPSHAHNVYVPTMPDVFDRRDPTQKDPIKAQFNWLVYSQMDNPDGYKSGYSRINLGPYFHQDISGSHQYPLEYQDRLTGAAHSNMPPYHVLRYIMKINI